MEELFTLVIFVVVGITQLVKHLNKQEKSGGGSYTSPSQSSQPQQAQASVRSLLSDALKEIQTPQQKKKSVRQIEKTLNESYNVSLEKKRQKSVTMAEVSDNEHRLATVLHSKRKLRDAFIMKEILDRPVSDRL